MPTQTKNTRNIFKGDNSILQKKPKFCDISYGINKKKDLISSNHHLKNIDDLNPCSKRN
jgi:hypothetical protein